MNNLQHIHTAGLSTMNMRSPYILVGWRRRHINKRPAPWFNIPQFFKKHRDCQEGTVCRLQLYISADALVEVKAFFPMKTEHQQGPMIGVNNKGEND